MKKSVITLLTLPFACMLLSGFFAGETIASITHVQGNCVITTMEQSTARLAMEGERLRVHDLLETYHVGEMDVSVRDFVGIRLLEHSRLKMMKVEHGTVAIDLVRGRGIFNIDDVREHRVFRVETPSADVEARGTQFSGLVGHEKNQDILTSFAVRAGVIEVTVKATGEIIPVESGNALDIPSDGSAVRSRPATDLELDTIAQASDIFA